MTNTCTNYDIKHTFIGCCSKEKNEIKVLKCQMMSYPLVTFRQAGFASAVEVSDSWPES